MPDSPVTEDELALYAYPPMLLCRARPAARWGTSLTGRRGLDPDGWICAAYPADCCHREQDSDALGRGEILVARTRLRRSIARHNCYSSLPAPDKTVGQRLAAVDYESFCQSSTMVERPFDFNQASYRSVLFCCGSSAHIDIEFYALLANL
jgi:hypothetical protein